MSDRTNDLTQQEIDLNELAANLAANIEYNSSLESTHGHWRCTECNSKFYGGGEALHRQNCSQKGYESCNYCYGDAEIKRISSLLSNFGIEHFHACWTELAILRKHLVIEDLDEKIDVYRSQLIKVKDVKIANREADAMKAFLLAKPPIQNA
jgi:NAD-dependent SIR2 family protein deacetylase